MRPGTQVPPVTSVPLLTTPFYKRFYFKCIITVVFILPLIFTALFFLVPNNYESCGRVTAGNLIKYIQQFPEHPHADTKNYIKPDFTGFLKNKYGQNGSYFEQRIDALLRFFQIKPMALRPEYFKKILEDRNAFRASEKFEGLFIHKLATKHTTKLVVFGDLEGAIHSFARCLNKLVELGIMNDDLLIASPDTYLVFIGDVIGRSAYNIETLSLILHLAQKNPNHVINLAGYIELFDKWTEFGLQNELVIGAQHLSVTKIPLQKEIDRYFESLPRAFFLQIPAVGVYDIVRFSYVGRSVKAFLDEDKCIDFLLSAEKTPFSTYHIDERKRSVSNIALHEKVIVKSEKKKESYAFFDGVRQVPDDKGATAWAFLSCPVQAYMYTLKFHTDSFALISTDENQKNWYLTHFAQDIYKKDGFKSRIYDFFTGLDIKEKIKKEMPQPAKEVVGQDNILLPGDIKVIEHKVVPTQIHEKSEEEKLEEIEKASQSEIESLVGSFEHEQK